MQTIIESFATNTSGSSGWVYHQVEKLALKVDKFIPLNGEGCIDPPQAVKT